MATYDMEQGFRSILNAALGEFWSKGFRLAEVGDHALMLYYRDEVVGVLTQGGSTILVIHEACREHLVSLGLEAS